MIEYDDSDAPTSHISQPISDSLPGGATNIQKLSALKRCKYMYVYISFVRGIKAVCYLEEHLRTIPPDWYKQIFGLQGDPLFTFGSTVFFWWYCSTKL